MNNDPLVFRLAIAQNKPSSFRADRVHTCPFCDVANLTDIYAQEGDKIWLHNKFPTLQATNQTVLIESHDHHGDISTYSQAYNRDLIGFALHCFEQMMATKRYRSVLWYKNFGPLSAGSLEHPHMQLVGLEDEDGYKYIHPNNFTGITVYQKGDVSVNIATHPVQGYQEININSQHHQDLKAWADWIQVGTKFVLQAMYGNRCQSYNLFFYPLDQAGTCCKIIPRFATSPYFVGYKLSQANDELSLEETARRYQQFVQKPDRLK